MLKMIILSLRDKADVGHNTCMSAAHFDVILFQIY